MSNEYQPSREFVQALEQARALAMETGGTDLAGNPLDDDAVRYMAENIPIYAQAKPTPEQAVAGGCPKCTYLGLWADRWPGYAPSRHGIIWVFEQGVRSVSPDWREQTYRTLLHEFDHALERDHVLDAMEEKRRKAAAMAYIPQQRPCGSCGR